MTLPPTDVAAADTPGDDDPHHLNNFTAQDLQRILNRPGLPADIRAAAEDALLKLAGGQRIKSQAEIDLEVAEYANHLASTPTGKLTVEDPTAPTPPQAPDGYRYVTVHDLVEERI